MHQAQKPLEGQRAAPSSDLMDVAEAAKFLHVSIDYLNRLRMRGRERQGPPYIKYARKVRYRKQDLENWLASQVVNPLSE